jgi:hypothetical protein
VCVCVRARARARVCVCVCVNDPRRVSYFSVYRFISGRLDTKRFSGYDCSGGCPGCSVRLPTVNITQRSTTTGCLERRKQTRDGIIRGRERKHVTYSSRHPEGVA